MALNDSLDWRRVARTLGAGALVLFAVALMARVLPVPVSPFLLGALAAVVFWLMQASRSDD